ncbi:MAG TPA: hypothetical protein VFJ06_10470 [Halococcus sp.]|nr:hypothetical protein [Halococcus sp.]
MSLAAETRRAARENPFIFEALRAGVLNYTAAARYLDVGETEAVAVALRRYGEDLPERETSSRETRIIMQRGLGVGNHRDDALLAVGESALVPDEGSLTGVLATGDIDAVALAGALSRLATEGIEVAAAGVVDGTLVVAVDGRDGPDTIRITEESLSAVPF